MSQVKVERGTRDFAPGDRVIFLKNERGISIKNGSLGTLDRVDPQSMQVRLDSGRTIAFELKDYAHLDHGYAATIHKAQGVTVDRVHVLATPGLDRHAAYVALSRHREAVALHYGRDDFARQRQADPYSLPRPLQGHGERLRARGAGAGYQERPDTTAAPASAGARLQRAKHFFLFPADALFQEPR